MSTEEDVPAEVLSRRALGAAHREIIALRGDLATSRIIADHMARECGRLRIGARRLACTRNRLLAPRMAAPGPEVFD